MSVVRELLILLPENNSSPHSRALDMYAPKNPYRIPPPRVPSAKRGTHAEHRRVCISPRRSRRALFQHGAILFHPPNSRRVGMPP